MGHPSVVRRPYLRAADRPVIPYLGPPEDHFRAAFLNAYGNVRARIRTTPWADVLAQAANPDEAFATVRLSLLSANAAFRDAIVPVFAQASMLGGRNEGITSVRVRSGPHNLHRIRKAEPDALDEAAILPDLELETNVVPLLDAPSGMAVSSAYHIEAAQNMAMDLITRITNQQEAAIRQIVTEAFERGIDPLVTGARIANQVGLFPRWQRAVDNFYQHQLDMDVTAEMAARRASRYSDVLLQKRGVMIARTELMRAMNEGRQTQWRAMADEGRLDPDESVKVWNAAPGACPVCEAMDGVGVKGITSFFETELGDFDHPPIHPHCRCTMNLIAIPGDRGLSGRG